MSLDTFTTRLGIDQGCITTNAGEAVVVLGTRSGGYKARISPGDRAQITQTLDLTNIDLIRVTGHLDVRNVPQGLAWEAVLVIDGTRIASLTGRAGATRSLKDLSVDTSRLLGTHDLSIRIEAMATGHGTLQVWNHEAELPAMVLERVIAVARPSALALINRNPVPDEQDVPQNSAIDLKLIVFEGDTLDPGATRVFVDGQLVLEGQTIEPGFIGPGASVDAHADRLRLRLVPERTLKSQAWVEVRVKATTHKGEALDTSYRFQVEDRTAPRLLATRALGPRTIELLFDEPVEVSQVTLRPLSRPAVIPGVLTLVSEGVKVLAELDTTLSPGIPHEVVVDAARDRAGNSIQSPFDRAHLAGWRPARPARRRFDLWDMLPRFNRRVDVTGDLERFIACLQEVVDLLLADIDRFTEIFDIERAPPAFLALILQDLGNPFTFELNVLAERRLAAALVDMYRLKGTARGIRDAVRFFLGFEVEVVPFADKTLTLGFSLLGVDWELGAGESFTRYAFSLKVARRLSALEETRLRALVEYLKPAHTHLVDVLQPMPAPPAEMWILGEGVLGVATTLHA